MAFLVLVVSVEPTARPVALEDFWEASAGQVIQLDLTTRPVGLVGLAGFWEASEGPAIRPDPTARPAALVGF